MTGTVKRHVVIANHHHRIIIAVAGVIIAEDVDQNTKSAR